MLTRFNGNLVIEMSAYMIGQIHFIVDLASLALCAGLAALRTSRRRAVPDANRLLAFPVPGSYSPRIISRIILRHPLLLFRSEPCLYQGRCGM